MAGKKIIELPKLGRAVQQTDLLEISDNGNGSYKVSATDLVPISFQKEIPNIIHNGNQATGITVNYDDIWAQQPEYNTWVNYPMLGISKLYKYKVGKYTGFRFLYDNQSYSYPTEITVDNEAILYSVIQLYGAGYTLNMNCKFLGRFQNSGYAQINLPICIGALELYVQSSPYVAINAPQLEFIQNSLGFGGMVDLINVPSLELVGGLQFQYSNHTVPTIDFSSLKYIVNGNVYIYQALNLQSMDWSNVQIIERDVYIDQCSSLTSLVVPNLKFLGAESSSRRFNVYNTPLDQESVDSILTSLDLTGQYNGQVYLAYPCSSPSASGYQAAQNLMNKGWSVTTN